MLNMGFKEDIEEIFERTNGDKTTLLFSATMPAKIREITTRFMGKFQSIKVKPSVEKKGNIEHKYYKVKQRDKANVLLRLINMYDDFYGIIFCNTKREVDELTNMLAMSGFKAEGLHGDIAQQNRERVLNKFKNRKTDILVATDVAGRGIDI
jgi:ATP-dependent RNA helicase DeaD